VDRSPKSDSGSFPQEVRALLTLLPPLGCPSCRSGPTPEISAPLHDVRRASPWGFPHVDASPEGDSSSERFPDLAPKDGASWHSKKAVRSPLPDPLASFLSPSAVSACSTFAALFRAAAVSRLCCPSEVSPRRNHVPLSGPLAPLRLLPGSELSETDPAVSPSVSRDVRDESASSPCFPSRPERRAGKRREPLPAPLLDPSPLRREAGANSAPPEKATRLSRPHPRGGSGEVPTQPPSGELPRSPDD